MEYSEELVLSIVEEVIQQAIDEGILREIKRATGNSLKKHGVLGKAIGTMITDSARRADNKDKAIKKYNSISNSQEELKKYGVSNYGFTQKEVDSLSKSEEKKKLKLKHDHNISDDDIRRGTTEAEAKIADGARHLYKRAKDAYEKVKQAYNKHKSKHP